MALRTAERSTDAIISGLNQKPLSGGFWPFLSVSFYQYSLLTVATLCLLIPVVLQADEFQPGFSKAKDWDQPVAEVLTYEVSSTYLGKERKFTAFFVTEAMSYSLGEGKGQRRGDHTQSNLSTYQFTISYNFEVSGYLRSHMAFLRVFRGDTLALLRQNSSIQDWNCLIERVYRMDMESPVLQLSSRLEGDKNTVFKKSPILTTEYLFLYLRSIPLKEGYKESVWLLKTMLGDVTDTRVYYAQIEVHPKLRHILGEDCHYVTISLEGDQKYEFWLIQKGLHQIMAARLSDGSSYTLKNINWKRYWYF